MYTGLFPFIFESLCYNGSIVGFPLAGQTELFYYRLDLFEKYNLTVPVTWEDALEIAQRFNGTDFDGDGEPDYAHCYPLEMSGDLLVSMLAPQTQYQGPQQGFLFDPDTMEPLVNNPAMKKALKLTSEMTSYSNDRPFSLSSLTPYHSRFHDGKCLFASHFAHHFKLSPIYGQAVLGNIGITPPLGMEHVLDRQTMELIRCDAKRCSDSMQLPSGKSRHYNLAPEGWGRSHTISLNPYMKTEYRFFFNDMMRTIYANSGFRSQVTYSNMTYVGPMRPAEVEITEENLNLWDSHGFNRNDTIRFLMATDQVFKSTNLHLQLRIHDLDKYR
eukprot:gene11267-18894_t